MRKIIGWCVVILVVAVGFATTFIDKPIEATNMKVIPKEAIRLRILANSDAPGDQALKQRVRDKVNAAITLWVKDIKEIEEGRKVIQQHLPEIEQIVETTLREAGSKQSYKVEFNKHVQFPTKVYGDMIYKAGEYEAILITLGAGEGANWWCVLYPPLCFMDFSNGEAISSPEPVEPENQEVQITQEPKEVEVRFFLKDMLYAILD